MAYARLIYPHSTDARSYFSSTENRAELDMFYAAVVVSHLPEHRMQVSFIPLLDCLSILACTQHPNVHYSIIDQYNLMHTHI